MTSNFIYSKNTGIGSLKLFRGKYQKFENVLDYIEGKEEFCILEKNAKKHLELWEHKFNFLKRKKIEDQKIISMLLMFANDNRKRERVVGGEFIPRNEINYIILPSKNLEKKRLVKVIADAIEQVLFDEKYWTGKNKELKYWLEYIVRWFENDALGKSKFERLVPDEDMNMFQLEVEKELIKRRI